MIVKILGIRGSGRKKINFLKFILIFLFNSLSISEPEYIQMFKCYVLVHALKK